MSKIEEVQANMRNTPGLKSSMTKWAVGGAVAGIVLPGLGSVVGAIGGAAFAYYKGTKRS